MKIKKIKFWKKRKNFEKKWKILQNMKLSKKITKILKRKYKLKINEN